MKKFDKKEGRKFEIDIMLDQAKDIATSTRETRALVARMVAKDMSEMLSAQIEKAKTGIQTLLSLYGIARSASRCKLSSIPAMSANQLYSCL